MKLAIVCDDLVQFGGQERLVLALTEVWPNAPLYTAYVSQKWLNQLKQRKVNVKTSYMQKLPLIEKLYRYYAVLLLQVIAFEIFDFSEYDIILSVSSRFSHAAVTKPGTTHICYMNSPGRMIWEPAKYFEKETFGILKPFGALANILLSFPLTMLRMWDRGAVQRVDAFVANSKNAASRIKKYYRRESEVIYPFVDIREDIPYDTVQSSYFIVISRLQPWKRVDVAVTACTRLGLPLKIIGEGPDLERLKSIAGPTVEFLGYISEVRKKELLRGSLALINTQKEDFGIVPLEALAFGKPVIAYGSGGVLETVKPGLTGEFFYEQTPEALESVLRNFDKIRYNSNTCALTAGKFTKETFKNRIKELVDKVYLSRIAA